MRTQLWQWPSTLSATRPPITWVPPALPQRTTSCDRKWATSRSTPSKSLNNSPTTFRRCASSNFYTTKSNGNSREKPEQPKLPPLLHHHFPRLLHHLLSLHPPPPPGLMLSERGGRGHLLPLRQSLRHPQPQQPPPKPLQPRRALPYASADL